MNDYIVRSELKRWNIKKNIILKGRDDPRTATHLLMDGGKVHISKEAVPIFNRKYAADLITGATNFILEVKTPIYKLFMDLDTYEPVDRDYSEMRPWIKAIQKVISDMYPNLTAYERRVIVCTTDSTPDSFKNGNVYTKLGFAHLYWPGILIDNNAALKFRAAVIQHMEKTFGKRHEDNPWEDVIDETIYVQNGLRMVGSAKAGYCRNCKDEDFCDICYGTHKYYIGRIYKIKEIMNGDGVVLTDELKTLTKDTLSSAIKMVEQTSLRSFERFITEQTKPDWFDDWHFEQKEQNSSTKRKKKFYVGNRHQLTVEDQTGFKEHDLKERLEKDSKEYKRIKRLINAKMPAIYKNVEIMDIHVCNKGENNYYLVRTNSSFCMNIAREHNSNTIYFVITEFGLCQKCFCRCNNLEGRKFGLCKDYHSNMVSLSLKDKKALFPNTKNKLQEKTFLSNDAHNEKKLIKELLQNKINEMQMWQDYLDGKAVFEERFNKKGKTGKAPENGRRLSM
jgi:hypothetical protein